MGLGRFPTQLSSEFSKIEKQPREVGVGFIGQRSFWNGAGYR
jgi:hypothetical protein